LKNGQDTPQMAEEKRVNEDVCCVFCVERRCLLIDFFVFLMLTEHLYGHLIFKSFEQRSRLIGDIERIKKIRFRTRLRRRLMFRLRLFLGLGFS
jgi:hypothetical protein